MGRIAIAVKVGDKKGAVGKDYLCIKEGSVIAIIDEDDPVWKGKTLDEVISADMKRIFCIIEIDRGFLPTVKESLKEVGTEKRKNPIDEKDEIYIPDPSLYRPRKYLFELSMLADKLGDSTLVEKWKGPDSVSIKVCKDLVLEDLTDALTKGTESVVPDLNLVTSGSYNVGSGETYTTVGAALNDIGNLTGNLTFTVTSDTSSTATATLTEDLGGYTLKVTSNKDHKGVIGGGWRISSNIATRFVTWGCEGPGTVIFEKLEMLQTASATGIHYFASVSTEYNAYMRNLILDCDGYADNAIEIFDAEPIVHSSDIVILDAITYGMYMRVIDSASKIENCTIIDSGTSGIYIGNTQVCTLRNVAIDGSGTADFGGDLNDSTANTCASGDATAANGNWAAGTGNRTSIANSWTDRYKITAAFTDLYDYGSNPTITGLTKYINDITIVSNDNDIGAWGVSRATTTNNSLFFGTNF